MSDSDTNLAQIQRLSDVSLAALRDVLLDIREQLDFSPGEEIEIPMWPPYFRSRPTQKGERINHDDYEQLRTRVLRQLAEWGVLGEMQLLGSRFKSYMRTNLNAEKYKNIFELVEQQWLSITKEESKKNIPNATPTFNPDNALFSWKGKELKFHTHRLRYWVFRLTFEIRPRYVTFADIEEKYGRELRDNKSYEDAVTEINRNFSAKFHVARVLSISAERIRMNLPG